MSDVKQPHDRATVTPIEDEEVTDGGVKDPIVKPTDNWPKDEPRDPIVKPTDNWPKDEPRDPIVTPTDNWPKDEPTKVEKVDADEED